MMEISITTTSQESESASRPSAINTATIALFSRKRQPRRRRRQPVENRRQHSRISRVTATTLLCCLSLLCTSRITSVQVTAYVPSPLFPSRTKWIHDDVSISSSKRSCQHRHGQHGLYAVQPAVPPPTSKQWKPVDDGDRDLDKEEAGWLSWMVRGGNRPRPKEMEEPAPRKWSRKAWIKWISAVGKKSTRGSSDLRMREAEELGGLARPDRYSSRDWFHNTLTLPGSAILRDIKNPVIVMTSWATFLACVFMRLEKTNPISAQHMCIPTTPHTLMVSSLSLLLVFKTNSAYQRFAEGRKIWETIINAARDLYRMMNLYGDEIGRTKRRRLQRLLAAFPYLLRHRIRPNLVMYRLDDEENIRDPEYSIVLYQDRAANDLDPEATAIATAEENKGKSRRKTRPLYWVDKRTLPWRLLPQNALEQCARTQNRPLWVCDRMAFELKNVPDGPNFSARERLALISKVDKLSACIGACERIHQTAVPLNYARHSLRALTLWLLTLPFALVGQLRLLTGPVLFLVSWLLFGVYEIGYSIEDPFQGTLRLSVLCDMIRRDVMGDEVTRSTAFEIEDLDKEKAEKAAAAEEKPKVKQAGGDYQDYEEAPIFVEEKEAVTDELVEEKKFKINGFTNATEALPSNLRERVPVDAKPVGIAP